MDRLARGSGPTPMPVDAGPAPDGLPLAIVLLMLAGWVDALGIVRWHGLYVSFMSGNTTALGALPATGDWHGTREAARAVLVFVAGVVLGESIGPAAGRWRGPAVVGTEAALLWLAFMSDLLGWSEAATASVTGFAMGVQTAAVHKAHGMGIALTYVTGTLVNLGRGIAAALRGAAPWRGTLLFLGLWASLLVGALAGSIVSRAATGDALAIAATVATGVAILAARGVWRRGPNR